MLRTPAAPRLPSHWLLSSSSLPVWHASYHVPLQVRAFNEYMIGLRVGKALAGKTVQKAGLRQVRPAHCGWALHAPPARQHYYAACAASQRGGCTSLGASLVPASPRSG